MKFQTFTFPFIELSYVAHLHRNSGIVKSDYFPHLCPILFIFTSNRNTQGAIPQECFETHHYTIDVLYTFLLITCDLFYPQIHSEAVTGLAVASGVICTASEDGTLKLWIKDTFKQVSQNLLRCIHTSLQHRLHICITDMLTVYLPQLNGTHCTSS